jgi:hypothetical protein
VIGGAAASAMPAAAISAHDRATRWVSKYAWKNVAFPQRMWTQ